MAELEIGRSPIAVGTQADFEPPDDVRRKQILQLRYFDEPMVGQLSRGEPNIRLQLAWHPASEHEDIRRITAQSSRYPVDADERFQDRSDTEFLVQLPDACRERGFECLDHPARQTPSRFVRWLHNENALAVIKE